MPTLPTRSTDECQKTQAPQRVPTLLANSIQFQAMGTRVAQFPSARYGKGVGCNATDTFTINILTLHAINKVLPVRAEVY